MKTRAIIEGKKRIAKDFLIEKNQSLKKIAFLSKSLDLNCYKSYFLILSSLEEIVSSQKLINFDFLIKICIYMTFICIRKRYCIFYKKIFIFMKKLYKNINEKYLIYSILYLRFYILHHFF